MEHHAALLWKEIGSFMARSKAQDGVSAPALRFLILMAARTKEAIGAGWSEITVADGAWTVPADSMKAGREHRALWFGDAMDLLRQAAKLRQDDKPDAPVYTRAQVAASRQGWPN
jgi:integrase